MNACECIEFLAVIVVYCRVGLGKSQLLSQIILIIQLNRPNLRMTGYDPANDNSDDKENCDEIQMDRLDFLPCIGCNHS